jgi:hypothetical protein
MKNLARSMHSQLWQGSFLVIWSVGTVFCYEGLDSVISFVKRLTLCRDINRQLKHTR